jgi:hypothetical protein
MSDINYLDAKTFRDEGYLSEVNRVFFHPLGLALSMQSLDGEAIIKVLDYRNDPEGMNFVAIDEDIAAKALRLARISAARRNARRQALGYWIQPVTS